MFDVFECVADVFDVLVDVPAVFETVVVPALVVEAVFDTDVVALEFDMFVLVLFAFDVLFAVSPPQAAPKAARPRNAESAIAFFM